MITKEDILELKIILAENILELKKLEKYGRDTTAKKLQLRKLMEKLTSLQNDYQIIKLGDE